MEDIQQVWQRNLMQYRNVQTNAPFLNDALPSQLAIEVMLLSFQKHNIEVNQASHLITVIKNDKNKKNKYI